jgi:hypothetical protein
MTIDLEAITRETVASILKTDIANVTFTKADGTERVMKCTLVDEYIPNTDERTSTRSK